MDNFYTVAIIICLIATQPIFLHCEMEVFEFRMFNLLFSWKFYVRRLKPNTEATIICLLATQPIFLHCEMEVFEFRMFNLLFSWKFYVRRLKPKNLLFIKLMFILAILIEIALIRLLTDREWLKKVSPTYNT